MLVPYESLCQSKDQWIYILASFMSVSVDDTKCSVISNLTSRDWMLNHVSKFNESWVASQRLKTGRVHCTIQNEAPKVRDIEEHEADARSVGVDVMQEVRLLHEQIWKVKVTPETGHDCYDDMVADILKCRKIKH